MPETVNLETLQADPEFQALPPGQQRRVLWQADPKPYFAEADRSYGLPTGTLHSIWATESGPGTKPETVKSRTGVRGPMQITQGFWKDYGEGRPYSTDPFDQMVVAGRGLSTLIQRHGGDLQAAIAAYGDPEDTGYAKRVLDKMPSAAKSPATLTSPPTTTPTPGPTRQSFPQALGESGAGALRRFVGSVTEVPAAIGGAPGAGTPLQRVGTVARALTPLATPLGPVGEIAGGTAARMAGGTPEQVTGAERVGGEIGAWSPVGMSLGARLVSRAAPSARAAITGARELAGRGVEQATAGISQAGQLAEREAAGATARGVTEEIGGRLITKAGETADLASRAERSYSSRVTTRNEVALGRTQINASGESPASAEALSRMASEKAAGRLRYRVDVRSGRQTPLLGPDAVDATAGSNEVIIQHNVGAQGGTPTVLSQGGNVPDATVKRAGARGYFTLPKPMTEKDYPGVFVALRKEAGESAQQAIDYNRTVTQRLVNLGPSATSVRLARDPDLLRGLLAHATPEEATIITRAVEAGQPLHKMPFTADELSQIGQAAVEGRGMFGGIIKHHLMRGIVGGATGAGLVMHPGALTTHPGAAALVTAGILVIKGFDALAGTRKGYAALRWLSKAPAGSLAAQAGLRHLGQQIEGPRELEPPVLSRALGGPVPAGVPTLVGEHGPELIVSQTPSMVLAGDTSEKEKARQDYLRQIKAPTTPPAPARKLTKEGSPAQWKRGTGKGFGH